jgi:TnpA family transposase
LSETDGTLDRRTWELGLAVAVRDGLRSGDVFLPASRRHVSFPNLVYDPTRWQGERDHAYTELQLPQEADDFCARLEHAFDAVAQQAERRLPTNAFATIRAEHLHLKKRDALELPPRLTPLRRTGEGALPRVRIEALLTQVDEWGAFTRVFRRPGERAPRVANFSITLVATLIAHGTNLGIAPLAHSVEDQITADMLQEMSQGCLREETRKAANALLVNFHHRLPLSAVWGDGVISASDGQRFGLHARALLGSLYPRYFGYYDRAVTVYTHSAAQPSVFHTQGIACSVRAATYVLDGLLEHDTILRPKEHVVDQHGYTDQLFGLCHLLGYSRMPRLTVSKQTLYKLDRTKHDGPLDAVLHATVDLALIREQWDQLVRVAASLRNHTAPAHIVLPRLASSAPSDRLAQALSALGQALKTISLLRYSQDEALRARMQLQRNRGARRHQLARRRFVANQGAFQTGDYEEIMNKATCLSLLSHAVMVWHTMPMTRIIAQLRASGEPSTEEECARISPFASAHVIPNGTYVVRQPPRVPSGSSSPVSDEVAADSYELQGFPGALPYIFRRSLLGGQGAQRLLAQAIEAAIAVLFAQDAARREAHGRPVVVRHGSLPERAGNTGMGAVRVKVPRVRDRRGHGMRLHSAILPPSMRQSKSLDAVRPWLYLQGVSPGAFSAALPAR